MITADQIVCHAVGDYIIQTDYMANEKTKWWWPAFIHAFSYCVPFLLLTPSWRALLVMFVTHYLIDRYRLARFVNWAKNGYPWPRPITPTGYPPERPPWLATWLLIITDNILHIVINGVALKWL